jgi:hypothetical protein
MTEPAAKAPHRVARHIGMEVSYRGKCPSCVDAWLDCNDQVFGGMIHANKQFYGSDMTTWAAGHKSFDQEAKLPDTCLPLICFGKGTTAKQLDTYIKSIPAGRRVVMIPSQEYEGANKWPDPATFITWFEEMSKAIRGAGNPEVLVCADSAGSAYGPSGKGKGGSWIVPADLVDCYGIDCYQNQGKGGWPTQGLRNYPEFQTWLGHVSGAGKRLMICEYGVDSANGDSARHDRIAEDATYLGSFSTRFYAWLYWYSDCQAGQLMTDPQHVHQFHDAATISLWNSILAGTFAG